ncbi:MAG TPA: serine hydrolase domain-containing protein [Vicinamibacterales bacterium]|nr:serine hydrolase domain-containing protein [Vicinamibacterales bacterium]
MRLTARVVAASVMLATGVLAKGTPSPMAQVALAPPASIGLDSARLAEATALLRTLVAEGAVAGAVAGVARRDQVAYLEAVGVQDLNARTPMTERSLFRIYSMTKPITAVAVMMLHDQGRFRLDDPVSMYLPEFADLRVGAGPAARPPARPVTVEDLLLHTSGLSHRTSDLYRELQVRSRADTLPAFVTKITRAPLMEDPGTRFRYSEATTVLGRLVEVWSKQPFDRFLEERLLRPLKMTETRFWVPPDAGPRLATVYGPGPGGALAPVDIETVPFTERPVLIEGAVGLVSTVPDFLRFARMLLNEGSLEGTRVLEAATARRIVTNGLSAAVLQTRGGKMGWGLGNVSVVIDPSAVNYPASPGEYGWDGTAGTIFWNDPAAGTAIVLMTQSAPANPAGIRQRFKTLLQAAVR